MKKNRTIVCFFLAGLALYGLASCRTGEQEKPFRFRHHFINSDLPTGWVNGVQSLADYDNDGDLDMTVGSKPRGLYLLVNNDTSWATLEVGDVPNTSLGAAPLDIDGDQLTDLVSTGVWYRNQGDHSFAMYPYDPEFGDGKEKKEAAGHFHDLIATDINDDGKADILAAGEDAGFFWYNTSPIPGASWERTVIDPHHTSYQPSVHGGFSPGGAGDLDGDGDKDVFMAVAWFENLGKGAAWKRHPLEFKELFRGELPYGKSTRSIVTDIDRDKDNDIVFSECDDIDARIGIIENVNGDGTEWELILLPQIAEGRRCSLHSLGIADFNMDGHPDIITVDQEDMMAKDPSLPSPRWYIYTNREDKWEEDVLFDIGLGGHDIIIGDVDGDGDPDVVNKVWNPWKGSANKGRSHADFIENLTIK